MIILLHKPLSASGVILTAPCLFLFDLITLLLLYWGFVSRLTIIKLLAALVSILVVICSAAFASMYIQGNVELNWTRSVEVSYPYSLANVVKVLVHWKFFKNLMAEGHNSFGKVLALYALAGGTLVVLRMLLVAAKSQRHYQLAPSREKPEIVETLGFFETFVAAPLIRSVVLLIITLGSGVPYWYVSLNGTLMLRSPIKYGNVGIISPCGEPSNWQKIPALEYLVNQKYFYLLPNDQNGQSIAGWLIGTFHSILSSNSGPCRSFLGEDWSAKINENAWLFHKHSWNGKSTHCSG